MNFLQQNYSSIYLGILNMKEGSNSYNGSYYNQFVDITGIQPLHSRHKFKNNNLDNIKIASRKLPADFFRPSTRQNNNLAPILDRETIMKTPSFGDEKKESLSLSFIPKDKKKLQSQNDRILTLPQQQTQHFYKVKNRSNLSRELEKRQQPFSHRQTMTRQQRTSSQRRSSERQKIKYKKLTLCDEAYLQQKIGFDPQHDNKIRLNVKKFFKEQPQSLTKQTKSKSGRKIINSLQTISIPFGMPSKLKINKLPPLV